MKIERITESVRLIRKNFKTIATVVGTVTILMLIYALLLPNKYTSEASLLPTGSNTGTLGLIAGLLPGMSEQISTSSEISSFLFPEILRSRGVILAIVNEPFDSVAKSITGKEDLKHLHKWNTDDDAINGFAANSDLSYSIEKGTIKISYTSKFPYLSYFIVKVWLDKLEWYLQNNMQTQSKKEYEHLLVRKDESLRVLNEAEDSLKLFVLTHRNYVSDPIASMQYDHLRVILDTRQQIYSYTMQQLETAKINIVKSIPVVNILDSPQLPDKKSGPRRTIILFVGIILGCVLAGVWLFAENEIKRMRKIL